MSITTRRAAIFSASLACVAGSCVCLGQTGVYEGFAYPPGAELVGQSGGAGFSGPWQTAGYGGWQTGTSGLGRLKAWQLMQGQSGAQSMRSSSGGVQRTLASPISGAEGTVVWISFLAKHTGPTGGSWLGVKLPCSGAGSDPYLFVGKPYGRANWGVDNGVSGGVRETAEPALHSVRCVCRVGFHGGADDVTLWIDPVLTGEPDAGSAALHLPAYGSFADLRKVLLETGSIGDLAQGAIDELRVGSSYAEVTPVEEGVVVEGRRFRASGGRVAVAAGMGPRVRASSSGGPEFGADVEMSSLGATVELAPGEFAPGSRVTHRVRGWDGAERSSTTIERRADGGVGMDGRFPGAHSLHVVTLDGSGATTSTEEFGGEAFYKNINAGGGVVLWGPCLNGEFPHWYQTIELLPYPQLINGVWTWYRYVWTFGCAGNWSSMVRVEVYPQYDGPAAEDPTVGTLELRAGGAMSSFDVVHVAEELKQASVSGLGEAILASSCEDGGPCTDASLRRVRSSGIGSSGQDGVSITGGTPGPLTYQVDGADLCTAGATIATTYEADGTTASIQVEGLGERCMITPHLGGGGGGGWLVSVYDEAGVLVGQGPIVDGGGIEMYPACQAPKVPVWGWWYCPVGPNCPEGRIWSVVGCALMASWTDPNIGTERTVSGSSVFIQPIDNPPIAGVVTSTVTAANTTADLVVSRMSVSTGRPSCRADFNGDGFLDFFDYDDFVACFETGACPAGATADYNGDGFADFFDYDDFVAGFEAGC